MKSFLSLFFILTLSAAYCQDTNPEMTALSEKFNTKRMSIGGVWEIAYDRLGQPYAIALAAAEQDAKTHSRKAALSAIDKETQDLEDGEPKSPPPAGLPKSLEPERNKFLAALAKINLVRRSQTAPLDREYLKSLDELGTRHPDDQNLQAQIKKEKALVKQSK